MTSVGRIFYCGALLSLGTTCFGVVKQETLIRDATWASYVDFKANAYYELLPQLYKDKITVVEILPTFNNSFINAFILDIPRQWSVDIDNNVVYHMDALDALNLAAMAGSPEIAADALRVLPLSKAVPESGKTTDYKNKDVTNCERINIDQMLWQTHDWMITRLNQGRVKKAGAVAVSALACYGLVYNDFWKKILSFTGSLGFDGSGNRNLTPAVAAVAKWSTWPLAALYLISAHRLQNLYMDGFVQTFEVMLKSEKVVFDAVKTKAYLLDLASRVNAFKCSKSYEKRLLKLAATL